MQRVLRHCLRAALLAFLSLMAVAISPIGGVASAAPPSTTCNSGEGGPYCYLVISAPESVPVGQPFTVKVTLFEYGFGDNPDIPLPKSDFCASKAVVTLSVNESPIDSAKASAGVATFSVSVPSGGSQFLQASVDQSEGTSNCGYFDDGFAQLEAVTILPAGQPIFPCPDNVSCLQTTSGTGSAATLFAETGSFVAAFEAPSTGNVCSNGPPLDKNGVLSFTYTPDLSLGASTKTVVLALSPYLVTKGIGLYNVCYSSPIPFTPLGGGPLVTLGYLPTCSKSVGPPCVLFKTSTQHNGAFFGIQVPPGDPKVYPE